MLFGRDAIPQAQPEASQDPSGDNPAFKARNEPPNHSSRFPETIPGTVSALTVVLTVLPDALVPNPTFPADTTSPQT